MPGQNAPQGSYRGWAERAGGSGKCPPKNPSNHFSPKPEMDRGDGTRDRPCTAARTWPSSESPHNGQGAAMSTCPWQRQGPGSSTAVPGMAFGEVILPIWPAGS